MRTNACPTGPTTRYAAARQPSDTVTTVADQERPGTAAAPTAEHGRLGLALILVAAFMVVLDFSIVNVARRRSSVSSAFRPPRCSGWSRATPSPSAAC